MLRWKKKHYIAGLLAVFAALVPSVFTMNAHGARLDRQAKAASTPVLQTYQFGCDDAGVVDGQLKSCIWLDVDGGAQEIYHKPDGFTIRTTLYLPTGVQILKYHITRGVPRGIALAHSHPLSDYRLRISGVPHPVWLYHYAVQGEFPSLKMVLSVSSTLSSFCIKATSRAVHVPLAPVQHAESCYEQ